MPELVRITDVSPRDGLQNEPGVIPTADKARLVELLCATGVDEVEITSFVSPKWVPQLGDGAAVLDSLLKPPPGGRGLGVGELGAVERWRPPARNALTMDRAKALRKSMTGPEDELWRVLRQREWIGAKFRRQHPFGPYILDFFCQEKLLAVEVDGASHAGPEARTHDAERDAWVASQGVRTLRFAHADVVKNAAGVGARIRDVIRSSPSTGARQPTPNPLPPGGGFQKLPLFSTLVPNSVGLQSALDVNNRAGRKLISKVSVFTAASETFARKNTNASIAETLERFKPVIAAAHAEGLIVRGYVSCVIACPFEGPIPAERVAEVSDGLRTIGVDELDLGDTIGAGTPESVSALLDAVDDVWPVRPHFPPDASGDDLCTLHLHDTFGRAADCVRAALDLGVRSFDGSVAGLGGCPYASTPGKRAPGNIDTRLLVETIHHAGYTTNVDLGKLDEAAAFAREIVARARSTA